MTEQLNPSERLTMHAYLLTHGGTNAGDLVNDLNKVATALAAKDAEIARLTAERIGTLSVLARDQAHLAKAESALADERRKVREFRERLNAKLADAMDKRGYLYSPIRSTYKDCLDTLDALGLTGEEPKA